MDRLRTIECHYCSLNLKKKTYHGSEDVLYLAGAEGATKQFEFKFELGQIFDSSN